MKVRTIIISLTLASVAHLTFAQNAKSPSAMPGTKYARLTQSSMQRTLNGPRGSQPTVEYHFTLVWNSSQAPETFFWHGKDAWMNCKVFSMSKKKHSDNDIDLAKIRKGDMIELVPVPSGRFPMPEEIQNSITPAIFFKTANSHWMYLPVKKITRSSDVVMP